MVLRIVVYFAAPLASIHQMSVTLAQLSQTKVYLDIAQCHLAGGGGGVKSPPVENPRTSVSELVSLSRQ